MEILGKFERGQEGKEATKSPLLSDASHNGHFCHLFLGGAFPIWLSVIHRPSRLSPPRHPSDQSVAPIFQPLLPAFSAS